jgi:hypothetical protein
MTIRAYMWCGDAGQMSPEDPGYVVVASDVFDATGQLIGSIWRQFETQWHVRGTTGPWFGDFASQDQAVAALLN